MRLKGKIKTYIRKDGYGYIEPFGETFKGNIRFIKEDIGYKREVLFEPGDIVEFELDSSSKSLRARDVKIISLDNTPINDLDFGIATKLIAVNDYMAITQMLSPNVQDYKGYSNDKYLRGYRLGQIWKENPDSGIKRLVLRCVSSMLALHMKTQLQNIDKTPPKFLVDWNELNCFYKGKNNNSYGKNIRDLDDESLHALSRLTDTFSCKPMSLFKWIENGKDNGVILGSSEIKYLELIVDKESIVSIGGVNSVYFQRVNSNVAVNFYLDHKDIFSSYIKNIEWFVEKYVPSRIGEITSVPATRIQTSPSSFRSKGQM